MDWEGKIYDHLPLPVIVGPTAVGKTAAVVAALEGLACEVISADSRQIYCGLEIGSGAPSLAERARVEHHFIGELLPEERVSAGEYARLARRRIAEVLIRGRVPVVVGGSGLYIRALLDGLAPIPQIPFEVRRELEMEWKSNGPLPLLQELAAVDPNYAVLVGPRDRNRLLRALAVWRATGVNFSQWHNMKPNGRFSACRILGLTRPRPLLWVRIERRVKAMINYGWIEEVQNLIAQYGGSSRLPATIKETLGYKFIIGYCEGRTDLDDAIERVIIATRQFAKRQMTWFRVDTRVNWIEITDGNALEWTKTIRSIVASAGKIIFNKTTFTLADG